MIQFFRKLKDFAKVRLDRRKFEKIYNKYSDVTMIPKADYVSNLEIVSRFLNVEGPIVECGTWRGGMVSGISEILGENRKYYLCDSFEGLPEPTEKDGKKAFEYSDQKDSPVYYDNCKAEIKEAQATVKRSRIKKVEFVKGWFNETLKDVKFEEEIALLRMDADWYDSTMSILDNLYSKLKPGGLIIIDDYFYWEGCTKAVHDFLAREQLADRIQSHKRVCYIVKT